MVSNAIWKKTYKSEFSTFKDDQNCTSPQDLCNLRSLKNSQAYVFFQIARETIPFLVNNADIHEKKLE